LTPAERRGCPPDPNLSITGHLKFLWTFRMFYGMVLQMKGDKMSNYEEGFTDGIRFFKDQLLEWADTFEGDQNEDNYALLHEKLIEKLEQ